MKNYSKQREEIFKIVKKMNNIPTAEEIYYSVKKEDVSISKSTVYRNLNELVENSWLVKIPMLCGNDRYEFIDDKKNQGYLICNKCGQIVKFDCDDLVKNKINEILKIASFEVNSNSTIFCINGICDSCKEN